LGSTLRNIAFWVVLFLLVMALFNLFGGGSGMQSRAVSYSDFIARVESGNISAVTLDGERVTFRGADGQTYSTIKPGDADLTNMLIERGIAVNAKQQ